MKTTRVALSKDDIPDGWIGIAVSKTNSFVTDRMLEGALGALNAVDLREVRVLEVAGAFELIAATRVLLRNGAIGVIALGAVIRGETPHFEYIAAAVAEGLASISAGGHAVSFGVLTTDSAEQAASRAGGPMGNKGIEATEALLQLLSGLNRVPAK